MDGKECYYYFYAKNGYKEYDIIEEDDLYIMDFNLACTFDKNSKCDYFVHKNL